MISARFLLLILTAQSFLVPTLCTKDKNEEEILKQTLPAYAVISATKYLNSTRCRKELEELREAVDQRLLWGLKVLDASGKPASGFLYGNNFWLGSRSQCEDIENRRPLPISQKYIINASRYRHVEDEFPPFDLHFFTAHIRHYSTLQYHIYISSEELVILGMCLPDSCTTNELAIILKNIFKNRTLLFTDLYSADLELLEVKDLKNDHRWLINGGYIIAGLIFFVTISLMVAGTIYDVVILKRKKKLKFHSSENNNMSIQLGTKQSEEDPENQQMTLVPQSSLGQVIQAFSIYTNTKIVLNTKLAPDSIPAMHGLRFIGMVWLILTHTIFYMRDFADNKPTSLRKSDAVAAQVISNATFSVDSFFFIGGFLIAHLFLSSKEMKEIRRPLNYFFELKVYLLSIVKRFMRLTPAYMMAMAVFVINTEWYNRTSVLYLNERGDEICSKYWWRNILYIQNFFSRETMCMSWSWYVANDMQFFLIGTFLLMLSRIYFKLVVALLSILLVISVILTGYISYLYEYIPTLDQQYNLLDALYDPPWTRIGPYIVGIVTAYINLKLNRKLQLKRGTLLMLWILGAACNLTVLFGLVERHISLIASTFYSALSRIIWAIGIAWIVIACCTNNAGIINKILSFKAWIPLSRLTYCAYLLNPIIITSAYLEGETPMHVDFLRVGMMFFGNFVACFLSAYVFTLMFETPYVLLTKQMVSSLARKK